MDKQIQKLTEKETGGIYTVQPGTGSITLEDAAARIQEELRNTKQSFLAIGMYLKYVKDNELYKEDGAGKYKSIHQWADARFHLSQPTVSRLINVCEQFPVNRETLELEGKYSQFSVSQVIELLPMDQEQREELTCEITPEMTIKQIRKKVKEYKAKQKEEQKETYSTSNTEEEQKGTYSTPNTDPTDGTLAAIGTAQPGIPAFVNDEGMREWLLNPEAWGGLWYSDENIQANYYKYDFPDGCRLIAVQYRYSCPAYTRKEPWKYQQQLEADGTFCGEPHYHLLYSDEYLAGHTDRYMDCCDKYYTNNTISVDSLMEFLNELQTDRQGQENIVAEPSGNTVDAQSEASVQSEISGLQDMEYNDGSLMADAVLREYGLNDSVVMGDILVLLDNPDIDEEEIDEKVEQLLDSAVLGERRKIMAALQQLYESAVV